jgi:hypothetical protein
MPIAQQAPIPATRGTDITPEPSAENLGRLLRGLTTPTQTLAHTAMRVQRRTGYSARSNLVAPL